jgi:hypothetical protein
MKEESVIREELFHYNEFMSSAFTVVRDEYVNMIKNTTPLLNEYKVKCDVNLSNFEIVKYLIQCVEQSLNEDWLFVKSSIDDKNWLELDDDKFNKYFNVINE